MYVVIYLGTKKEKPKNLWKIKIKKTYVSFKSNINFKPWHLESIKEAVIKSNS